jgi:hypothetical protein
MSDFKSGLQIENSLKEKTLTDWERPLGTDGVYVLAILPSIHIDLHVV